VDIQRLAIEAGEHFTLDEVREMIQAADENGTRLSISLFPLILMPRLLSSMAIVLHVLNLRSDTGDGEIDMEEFMKMMKRTNFGTGF
jgi:calcium-binding protein CML